MRYSIHTFMYIEAGVTKVWPGLAGVGVCSKEAKALE
jgi:hypothetical protein